ncbi:hypothetical protein SAMN06296386_10882 [Lachnospiraceae bacterium]|nr:hypothetical protein SAMN06296386_10882 [Lachnospiraceae bacterium]
MTKNLINFQNRMSSEMFTDVISMARSIGFKARHYHNSEGRLHDIEKNRDALMISKKLKKRLA